MLFNALSFEEQNMIAKWIQLYGSNNNFAPDEIPLSKVLHYWNCNKGSYLYQLFGEKLILEKEVCYNQPDTVLEREIQLALGDGGVMSTFKNIVIGKFEPFSNDWYNIRDLFHSIWYVNNKFDFCCDCYNFVFEGQTVKVKKGSKPMKTWRKVAKIIGAEAEFEKFRIAHSMLLNQKCLKGTLCLSIHPFDFMTMSDNDYNWDSCMSWVNYGCYRGGTVEMMNSKYVVIAYLKGNHPYEFEEYSWPGNKKWRQLMVVHPHIICNIKNYPYQNHELSTAALQWLADLARQNLHWDIPYEEQKFSCEGKFDYKDGRSYSYNLITDVMYNDFDTDDTYHYAFIPQGWQEDEVFDTTIYEEINISGPLICSWCGDYIEDIDEGDEDLVVCGNCVPLLRCSECGGRMHEDYQYWGFDDRCYCEDCYCDVFATDALTEETIYREDMVNVYLARKENLVDIDTDCYIQIADYHCNKDALKEYSQYFTCDSIHKGVTQNGWRYYRYLYFDDCTEEGLRLFGLTNDFAQNYTSDPPFYYDPITLNPI